VRVAGEDLLGVRTKLGAVAARADRGRDELGGDRPRGGVVEVLQHVVGPVRVHIPGEDHWVLHAALHQGVEDTLARGPV
ncbi:MAG: hypothetical protein AVDCRST_MAG45-2474, partial [uncultured Solirubrobacterales bacterium]